VLRVAENINDRAGDQGTGVIAIREGDLKTFYIQARANLEKFIRRHERNFDVLAASRSPFAAD
jgi:hypothetical protein